MNLFKSALMALALTVGPLAGAAQATVNVLVATEDADTDTVPRDSRVYNRVFDALREELNVRGFQVYDETSVGLEIDQAHRVRRQDTELLEVARAVAPPMDAIVVFQIYASVNKSQYSDIKRPVIRITGHTLNAHSGQFLGAFEVGSGIQFPPLTLGCAEDRECLLETIGGQARNIAGDLGAALSEKLSAFITAGNAVPAVINAPAPMPPQTAATPAAATDGCTDLPTGYFINLSGFEVAEVQTIETYLVKFGCYGSHRVVESGRTHTTFWYETSSNSARLLNNLNTALAWENLKANVGMTGNNFRVDKITTR